jgi:hypothetical protein
LCVAVARAPIDGRERYRIQGEVEQTSQGEGSFPPGQSMEWARVVAVQQLCVQKRVGLGVGLRLASLHAHTSKTTTQRDKIASVMKELTLLQ